MRNGAHIFTDTKMAAAGINRKRLSEYGAAVNCTISDGDVIEEVEERGCMRAQVRMERGGRLKGDLIFAIGTPRPH